MNSKYVSTVHSALAGLPLGAMRCLDSVGSTNDEAARWVEEGAPDLALVIADAQTAGKGRAGRKWYTAPGASLAFSLVLRPAENQPVLPYLTALGALAVCDVLRQPYGLAAHIKWPNDVLIARRKIAGVLTEVLWQGEACTAAILGVGINIAPPSISEENIPPSALLFPVSCVESELGRSIQRFELLRFVLERVLYWHPRLSSSEFIQAWESALAFKGEWVQIIAPGTQENGRLLPGSTVQEGQLLGLAPDGSLRLRLSSGDVVSVTFGDLHLRGLTKES